MHGFKAVKSCFCYFLDKYQWYQQHIMQDVMVWSKKHVCIQQRVNIWLIYTCLQCIFNHLMEVCLVIFRWIIHPSWFQVNVSSLFIIKVLPICVYSRKVHYAAITASKGVTFCPNDMWQMACLCLRWKPPLSPWKY